MGKKGDRLLSYLKGLEVTEYGIGDIAGLHPLGDIYPKALALIIEYNSDIIANGKNEYKNIMQNAYDSLDKKVEALKSFLHSENIEYYTPDKSSNFSYPLAANRAGLGWIGKNSLLITMEYGPRVALQILLINCDVKSNKPIEKSECNKCNLCSMSCPLNCIHNVLWIPGMAAMELRNGMECEESGCYDGFCVTSCPKGMKK